MKKTTDKTPPKQDPDALATEQAFNDADGRVVARRRDVLMYELRATEEHLRGLQASAAEVKARRERLAAKVEALNRVIAKRR